MTDRTFDLWMTIVQVGGGLVATVIGVILGARVAVKHAERDFKRRRCAEAAAAFRQALVPVGVALGELEDSLTVNVHHLTADPMSPDYSVDQQGAFDRISGVLVASTAARKLGEVEAQLSRSYAFYGSQVPAATISQLFNLSAAVRDAARLCEPPGHWTEDQVADALTKVRFCRMAVLDTEHHLRRVEIGELSDPDQ